MAEAPTYDVTLPGVDIDRTSTVPRGSHVEGGTVSASSPVTEPVTLALQGSGPKVAALVVVSGVGFVVLVVIGGAVWWLLRRRRSAATADTQMLPTVPPPPAPPRAVG